MNTRTHVRPTEGGYEATCPACPWLYWSRSLPAVHTEAHHHTCTPILGPRMLPAGSTMAGAGSPMQVYADQPGTNWHRVEVWL